MQIDLAVYEIEENVSQIRRRYFIRKNSRKFFLFSLLFSFLYFHRGRLVILTRFSRSQKEFLTLFAHRAPFTVNIQTRTEQKFLSRVLEDITMHFRYSTSKLKKLPRTITQFHAITINYQGNE